MTKTAGVLTPYAKLFESWVWSTALLMGLEWFVFWSWLLSVACSFWVLMLIWLFQSHVPVFLYDSGLNHALLSYKDPLLELGIDPRSFSVRWRARLTPSLVKGFVLALLWIGMDIRHLLVTFTSSLVVYPRSLCWPRFCVPFLQNQLLNYCLGGNILCTSMINNHNMCFRKQYYGTTCNHQPI